MKDLIDPIWKHYSRNEEDCHEHIWIEYVKIFSVINNQFRVWTLHFAFKQVVAVVKACAKYNVPMIPYGGATSIEVRGN